MSESETEYHATHIIKKKTKVEPKTIRNIINAETINRLHVWLAPRNNSWKDIVPNTHTEKRRQKSVLPFLALATVEVACFLNSAIAFCVCSSFVRTVRTVDFCCCYCRGDISI